MYFLRSVLAENEIHQLHVLNRILVACELIMVCLYHILFILASVPDVHGATDQLSIQVVCIQMTTHHKPCKTWPYTFIINERSTGKWTIFYFAETVVLRTFGTHSWNLGAIFGTGIPSQQSCAVILFVLVLACFRTRSSRFRTVIRNAFHHKTN